MNDPSKRSDERHDETRVIGAGERVSPKSLAPGSVVAGRYGIESYLAAGGMGQVYRAHDLVLNVPLALKTIRPEIASDPAALRRFKQEVLLARSVSHPNVCRIFDLGQDETTGVSFLTMEFLPGETLASRIKARGAFSPEAFLPLVRQMADALEAAHRAGIVHRDFKSPNVMLIPIDNGDRAVIMDFGLAMSLQNGHGTDQAIGVSVATSDAVKTVAVEIPAHAPQDFVGTPAYMSPEQVMGGPVGPASDLYALGVVLFEMSTGLLPFRGATPLETARAHLTTPPPKPSTLAPIDDNWEETILRLLSKDPADRYATAHDAVLALEGRANGKKAARHSLPAERDAFVGRTVELEAIASHLEGSDGAVATRLLTLQGVGGTGKTRLTQKYGWESLTRWPGGVWFCDLSEARSVDGIAQAVATALDVQLGKDDPIVQLGNAIVGRGKSLLILDNFEQVVEYAEGTLGRWFARATETSFLATTRERLGLPEETTYTLEPLDPTTQGVELFEVRGQGHRPGFAVDDANRQQVEEIVQKLDGLPLAIELAAARLRMLSLEQLAERLADRFRLLAGGQRGRHATLAATLDWSWELLEPWEQVAIAQAAVFEGGFTLEAAEAVIDLDAHDEEPFVLDVIQSLVDKSWLRAGVALGAPRFAMYATVQEYASGKLRACDANDEADASTGPASLAAVEARHGAYFAEMGTEEAIEQLDRHGGVELRAALHLELDNLVAACRRAIADQEEEVAVATYEAASAVLALRGPFAASIRLGRDALDILKDSEHRGRALSRLADAERLAGMVEEARAHYEAALTFHREVGNRRGEGLLLGDLGNLHRGQGRMEEARAHYETALAIHREVGNRRGEGIVRSNLGLLHGEQGRMEEARAHYEAALAIDREVGDRRGEGIVLANLGLLHGEQGRMEEARAHYEAALAIDREVDNRRGEGIVLANLGILQVEQGRMEEARAHYEAALAIHGKVGDRSREGGVLGNLGNLHMVQGRMEEARAHYEAALTIHREVGNRSFEGIELGNLGILHREQGRMEDACAHYEAALAIHREVGNRRFEGIVLGHLGELLHWEQGRMEEARAHYEAALAIDREVGNRRFEGNVLRHLGNLHREQGRMEEARVRFEEGEALLRAVDDRFELGKLLCARAELERATGAIDAARATLREAEALAAQVEADSESELDRELAKLRRAFGGDA